MSDKPSAAETSRLIKKTPSVNARMLVRFLIFALLYPAVLFLAAGTLNWRWGWAYYGIQALSTIIGRLLVLRRHPELLAERASFRNREDTKAWDRILVRVVALYGPVISWIVAGLDHRWDWTPHIPASLRWIGLLAVLLGVALANWALVVNRFFAAVVRIQHDRGHQVVTDGPYRFIRHPGYAGGILVWLTLPLMLGSLWACLPASLTACALVLRTALEDRTLIEELPGYSEYAQHTRCRLLPGVW